MECVKYFAERKDRKAKSELELEKLKIEIENEKQEVIRKRLENTEKANELAKSMMEYASPLDDLSKKLNLQPNESTLLEVEEILDYSKSLNCGENSSSDL